MQRKSVLGAWRSRVPPCWRWPPAAARPRPPQANTSKLPDVAMATSVGAGEGQLNIIAWAGYAEDGSSDKTQDWVHPFDDADRVRGQRQGGQHLR